MTDEYIKTMAQYIPSSLGTSSKIDDLKIIEFGGAPRTTSVSEEAKTSETPKYMAPKTIEVRRYTLKK